MKRVLVLSLVLALFAVGAYGAYRLGLLARWFSTPADAIGAGSQGSPQSTGPPPASAGPGESGTTGAADGAPNLSVSNVVSSNVVGNWQTLEVSGTVAAEVANRGSRPVRGEYSVAFFEDVSGNGRFDPGVDKTLGRHPGVPLAPGGSAIVSSSISGAVAFRQNLVYAFIDSDVVGERDKASNYSHSGMACESRATGPIKPVVEWAWTGSKVEPTSLNVAMTPVVIDLSGDGIPEIVFGSTSRTSGDHIQEGLLRAVRGDNGAELFAVTDPQLRINAAASIAAGDIDRDGRPEILAADASGSRLLAFEHDGTFKWRSASLNPVLGFGAISLADLDGDGRPEVIVGHQALNNDGSIRWTGKGGHGAQDATDRISVVADVDLDGRPNVVAGNTLYNAVGDIVWKAPVSDGYNAVGNFDDDRFAEIVLVSGGRVWLLEHDGQVKWGAIGIPEGGYGGPPTVADFDGDGRPEVGVAGARRYAVYETDGSLKWAAVISDESSHRTGSSVFDFNGDGSAEVVYRDQTTLRIYRGRDGELLFQTKLSSCTWTEYVLVADVDADGSAEIVAPANTNCGYGPEQGVFIFGAELGQWVPTRKIWNQHAYQITNVNDDGTIPAVERSNWLTFNNYRQNVLTNGSIRSAPDLTASFLQVRHGTEGSSLIARIGNAGAQGVKPGVAASFYAGDPATGGTLLGTAKTSSGLPPGQFTDVTVTLPSGTAVPRSIWVVADDDGGKGLINECSETNNAHQLALGDLSVVAIGESLAPLQVELILDASGSMREQKRKVDGRLKIDIAKDVMTQVIQDLPDDSQLALRVYGHRVREGRKGDCEDSELVFPFSTIDKTRLREHVRRIHALGTTPIAYSLKQVARDFGDAGGQKMVILVTDGKEECKGNPSEAASELVAKGLKLRLNVVGFALAEEAVKQEMERIAALANGRFFDSNDAAGLRHAIHQALASPYEVLDAAGHTIAQGAVGEGAVALPEGIYTVVVDAGGKPVRAANVAVRPDKPTRIEFKKDRGEIGVRVTSP